MSPKPLFFIMTMAALGWTSASAGKDISLDGTLSRWDHDDHPDLRGVVVLRHGRRVGERYFNGATQSELHDIRSAGKSITALLVGIAIDRGAIRSVDDHVSRYWRGSAGSPVGGVQVRDILTMRSGLAAFDENPASPGNEDRMDATPDPLAFVRGLPSVDAPGTKYQYNSVTAYTAGIVVAEAAGMSLGRFAGRHLFGPLGITRWRWDKDAAGMTKGQGNLWLTTRDLARIGEMVRNAGSAHGRRVVSQGWITEMLSPRVGISATDPYADAYGYFWYRKNQQMGDARIAVSFASGNGGNKVYVVPACGLVVAITSSAYGRGYGQRRSETILKAILQAEVASGEWRVQSLGLVT